ncbi:hypothetical protein AGABI2DRAFT_186774 [Agaricus bisporus var. bisporus H97]|uniref:hypothetical protein n=1 Tax=Agaricus bisporus var. bisporus (strain H97 / ATCC MYA-4626 / FGSC 10389) TaxID=936046 RepID=UPI00029F6E6C|nr:hypothetical protein AGABI2DRAFT_186774 [Agaricus bisporus var. bisporus H97]EKV46153.1 hypothetical protein AGABI2DRAFT_186774 [Agaricus bisporus var. bisporus H97]
MRLILSSRYPRNSTYSTETGQVLYKVNKPNTFNDGIATIRKVVNTVNGVWQGDLQSQAIRPQSPHSDTAVAEQGVQEWGSLNPYRSRDSQDARFADSDREEDDPHNDHELGPSTASGLPSPDLAQYAFCAQVDFRFLTPTRFYYNGLNVPVTEYFRKEGWSAYGRGRVFKASDGKEYRWQLSLGPIEMIRNDESKERVVKYRLYRPSMGNFVKGRPPSLEVDDSCIPILDEIIMTFIYCHKLREIRERSHWGDGRSEGS